MRLASAKPGAPVVTPHVSWFHPRSGCRASEARLRVAVVANSFKNKGNTPSSLSVVKGKVVPVGEAERLRGMKEDVSTSTFHRRDMVMLRRACLLSTSTQGDVAPFPFSGCVLVTKKTKVVAETYQYASGTEAAELQGLSLAGKGKSKGATLYLNLEPSYAMGEEASVTSIVESRVARVVIGMENPLVHLRGRAIKALREAGVQVDCLRSHLAGKFDNLVEMGLSSDGSVGFLDSGGDTLEQEMVMTLKLCLETNENLLHCVAKGRPLCVLKYAMTFDGKTASVSGHSAWISGTRSRQLVYRQRALCDCVVVGGETARSDNPNLTTRRDEGHAPTRVVVSRTMDLPLDCNLWDVGMAPTLVITERGAKPELQRSLRGMGVEVIEIEGLSLAKVADHLYDRGFMRALWECGGVMAAPAISEGVISKVMAFVAPKIIGGADAPTPVGDALGLTKMSDALDVTDIRYEQVDQDVLATGYLPTTTSLFHLAEEAYALARDRGYPEVASSVTCGASSSAIGAEENAVRFYKAWNRYGILSNFFCVPIELDGKMWRSVEHYYQAMKFSNSCSVEAALAMDEIAAQKSAEEAARIGRCLQSSKPSLVRQDWGEAKLEVMRNALECKFRRGTPAWELLHSTCGVGEMPCRLIEYSPRDSFWGEGFDGKGENWLGVMLMDVRDMDGE